jgi:hypothetical protein
LNFSAYQWLSTIALDVLTKFVLVTGLGLLVTYGLVSIDMFVTPAIALSLLNFVCLFLGATGVATLRLFHVQLSPMLRFTASVLVANILFAGLLVVLLWPGPNDIPRSADGPVVVALILAASNLVTLLTVAAASRLIGRLKPGARAHESAQGS